MRTHRTLTAAIAVLLATTQGDAADWVSYEAGMEIPEYAVRVHVPSEEKPNPNLICRGDEADTVKWRDFGTADSELSFCRTQRVKASLKQKTSFSILVLANEYSWQPMSEVTEPLKVNGTRILCRGSESELAGKSTSWKDVGVATNEGLCRTSRR